MDLGASSGGSILSNMGGYNFENFDDDVSKESNDLTVDAGFVLCILFRCKNQPPVKKEIM